MFKDKKNRIINASVISVLILAVCIVAFGYGMSEDNHKSDVMTEGVIEAYEENGQYIQVVQAQGYNTETFIVMEVYIDMELNEVSKVSVTSHEETDDYGRYITESWFLDRFVGKATDTMVRLVKIIPEKDEDVVAITGATKSSQGIVNGVNMAMENYLSVIN